MDKAPIDLNMKLHNVLHVLPKMIVAAPFYLSTRFALVTLALFICGCAGLLTNGSGTEAVRHSHTVIVSLRWLAALAPIALVAGFAVWYRRLQSKLETQVR